MSSQPTLCTKIVSLFCFLLITTSAYSFTFETLYSFSGSNQGPNSRMIQTANGNFYGSSGYVPALEPGSLFEFSTNGTFNIIRAGIGYNSGMIQGTDGYFYGTGPAAGPGDGAVFKITAEGGGGDLYVFSSSGTNGADPVGGLVEAADGDFYGTTQNGGVYNWGTIFKITSAGILTTLHSFDYTNGANPASELIQGTDGNFYGTTRTGGASEHGTVFKMTPSGIFTLLHSFSGADGNGPDAALTQGTDGYFYGTTMDGGESNKGTVFKMTAGGVLTILHSFNSTNGARPRCKLVESPGGNYYGTTRGGGTNGGNGTIFKITPAGVLTSLFSCSSSEEEPVAGLTLASDGYFYGTTSFGGTNFWGSIFRFSDDAISSFTFLPASGPGQTTVIIIGSNFTGTTNVSFNGIAASFTVNSDTQITATVPCSATTGPITLAKPSGTAISSGNFVVVAPAPAITGFAPPSGPVGASVTVNGTNFNCATSVKFNGVNATTFTVNSSLQITATVPLGATTGKISVTTPGGTFVSAANFTVSPKIVSFSPLDGHPADPVTLLGFNFTGATSVKFNGVTASFTVISPTEINAIVPIAATTGPITVTSPSGTATSATAFKVLPKINSFNPTSGHAGTIVTINGLRLNDATNASFNGVSASNIISVSSTSVKVVVPNGATTGKISVATTAGAALSIPDFIVLPDTTGPTLILTDPKSLIAYTDASLQISGTAFDSGSIQEISYNHNNTGFVPASKSFVGDMQPTNWNSTITLIPGTNSLVVRATDLAVNITSKNVVFFYHTASPFTLVTNIVPLPDAAFFATNKIAELIATQTTYGQPTNEALLNVGRTYKLMAKDLAYTFYILSNWTATWQGQPTPVILQTNNPNLSFTMRSNMTVQANYITNPLVKYHGTYDGLFYESSGIRHESSGFMSLKVTPKFGVTGRVYINGDTISFSGKLNIDGTYNQWISRVNYGKPGLWVNAALDLAGGTETFAGTVAEVAGVVTNWTADLLTDRYHWTTNAGQEALQYTNAYTMILPAFANNADGPIGYSHWGLSIDKAGNIKHGFSYAADQLTYKPQFVSTRVSKDGMWPFYAPLYKVKDQIVTLPAKVLTNSESHGSMIGWLTFAPNTNAFAGNTNLSPQGEISWIKKYWTNATYVNGFTNQAAVLSSRQLAAGVTTNRIYNFTNAFVVCLEGNLLNPFTNIVFLKTNNAMIVTNKPGINLFTISADAKAGKMAGKFNHPDNTNAVTKWWGVMLQDYNFGRGTFVGTNATEGLSGQVLLDPRD